MNGSAEEPLVSIILTTFNGRRFVDGLVCMLQAQTHQRWECIVVDDGSSDGTLAAFTAACQDDDRFRLCPKQPERNVGIARSYGIERARGEFIAILDHDDLWHHAKLQRQVLTMQRTGCAMSYTGHANFSDDSELPDLSAAFKPTPSYKPRRLLQRLTYGNFICLSSILIRRDSAKQIGGFGKDVTLRNCEDYYTVLCYAAASEIVKVPEVLTFYRDHPGGKSKNPEKMVVGLTKVADLLAEDGKPDFVVRRVRAQAAKSEASINLFRDPRSALGSIARSMRYHLRPRTTVAWLAALSVYGYSLVRGHLKKENFKK